VSGRVESAGGGIVRQRQIGGDVLADRDRHRPARRRRRGDLHARAVGQAGGEQGMLAADALMRERGDLARQPLERRAVEPGRVVPLDRAAQRLDPDLVRRLT
jgi:hypothetical protein